MMNEYSPPEVDNVRACLVYGVRRKRPGYWNEKRTEVSRREYGVQVTKIGPFIDILIPESVIVISSSGDKTEYQRLYPDVEEWNRRVVGFLREVDFGLPATPCWHLQTFPVKDLVNRAAVEATQIPATDPVILTVTINNDSDRTQQQADLIIDQFIAVTEGLENVVGVVVSLDKINIKVESAEELVDAVNQKRDQQEIESFEKPVPAPANPSSRSIKKTSCK